jgi:hypothetical protein
MSASATQRCFAFLSRLQRLSVPIRRDFGKPVTDAAQGNLPTQRTFAAAAKPAQRVGRDSQDFSGGALGDEAVWPALGNISHRQNSPRSGKHQWGADVTGDSVMSLLERKPAGVSAT